eukprot:c48645_g1_i1 orf=65-340(-)
MQKVFEAWLIKVKLVDREWTSKVLRLQIVFNHVEFIKSTQNTDHDRFSASALLMSSKFHDRFKQHPRDDVQLSKNKTTKPKQRLPADSLFR